MNPAKVLGSTILLKAAIQTVLGVPEVFGSEKYIPATQVSDTSENPVTITPILTSPENRNSVAFATDAIQGNTLKTYLFSLKTFVGKQVSPSTALGFMSTDELVLTTGQTIILDGITATSLASATVLFADFVEQYAAYATAGTTPGADFSFTGTASEIFDLFYDVSPSPYLYFVAKDPLYAGTMTNVAGTIASTPVLFRTTGNANQANLPEIYPLLAAGGLSPTFGITLGLKDDLDGWLEQGTAFHVRESEARSAAITAMTNLQNLLTSLQALDLGTDGNTAADTLRTAVNALLARIVAGYASSSDYALGINQLRQSFASSISAGDYLLATENIQTALADLDGAGFVRIGTPLAPGKSLTILGRTLTNSGGSNITKADVVSAFANDTGLTGTITSGYSFSAKTDPHEIRISKTGDMTAWAVTYSSTQSPYVVSVFSPFETVYETSAARADILSKINALSNDVTASANAFSNLKAEINRVWVIANTSISLQDSLWAAAQVTGAWYDKMIETSTDVVFLPHKLAYVYTNMVCTDTGITDTARLTVESQKRTETGDRMKVTSYFDAIVSTLDLSIMANQKPELSFTLLGEPSSVTYEDGVSVSFSQDRLETMPEMKPGNVTFLSLVEFADDFVNQNVALQEFSLPNAAGITATRLLTAEQNFHRLATDPVGRKASLKIIESDETDTGAIADYRPLIGKPMKFRIQIGNLKGYTYKIDVEGKLTADAPSDVQTTVAARQLELTVDKFTLTMF